MDFSLSPEQVQFADAIFAFAREQLNDNMEARDREATFSRELWTKCAEFGLLGLPIPPEYGGQGQDLISTIAAMEALGRGCLDNGLVFSLNAQIWSCEMPILRYGSEAQKREWLPRLVSGEALAAHGMTEPGAGSDTASIESRAERVAGGYRLNGSKNFSTNGPVADLALAFAYVDRSSEKKPPAMTAFLVPRAAQGVTFTGAVQKMGLRTSPMGEIVFDDCFLPESARLGPEGAGMAIFNSAMVWERACIFAAHLGAMERILDDAIAYARTRRQFNQPIAKFESVANRIADMKVAIEAGKFLVYYVGWLHQQGKSTVMESAIAKLFVSENHVRSALDALQIFGGYGYVSGAVEREIRDALSGRLYSGTSDIQRRIIARCLGL